jgi:tRNA(fMet)-specific endonuclease VapC
MAMTGKFLLDTNIIIALFAKERRVLQKLRNAERVYLSSIAVGELLYGAHKSTQARSNIARIEEFAAANSVLACDLGTARHYGRVKDRLRRKGRPLPENDIWMAALARQHGLMLVSRDAHFTEVENLTLKAW